MNSLFKLSPFTTIVGDKDIFTLVFWGAYKEPLVYSIDDPSHPMYEIIALKRAHFAAFPDTHADDFANLIDEGIIVSENWDRQTAIDEYLKVMHSPEYLHLILLPAGTTCNCDCQYCGQDHNGKGMSWEHDGNAILQFIKKRAPEALNIEFYGGEPLCALPFIERLGAEIHNVCQSTGMKFQGSMTTNGTLLTPETFTKLMGLQITEYQITIDGIEEHHNRLRPLRNGGNSYQQIIGNLRQIKEIPDDYSITLRMNFDTLSSESDSVSRHLTEINNWVQKDQRFSLRFRPAFDWGGDIETTTLCSKMQASELTSELNSAAAQMGFRMADIGMWAVDGHACYAGKENSFVIEPGLKVKKCTVSENANNTVGHITTEGDLETNQHFESWVRKFGLNDHGCNNCEWMPVCLNVGCPLIAINSGDNCLRKMIKPENVATSMMNWLGNQSKESAP